jgi:hypothetical protein
MNLLKVSALPVLIESPIAVLVILLFCVTVPLIFLFSELEEKCHPTIGKRLRHYVGIFVFLFMDIFVYLEGVAWGIWL